MSKSKVPIEWVRLARQGRSAKWIAKALGIEDWRVVHRALLGSGAYRF